MHEVPQTWGLSCAMFSMNQPMWELCRNLYAHAIVSADEAWLVTCVQVKDKPQTRIKVQVCHDFELQEHTHAVKDRYSLQQSEALTSNIPTDSFPSPSCRSTMCLNHNLRTGSGSKHHPGSRQALDSRARPSIIWRVINYHDGG